VTVGRKTLEDGAVDVRDRATGEERRVAIGELAEAV
jgi:glycyl-tRNA synthetase (class II)